jgi:hypothetical protein
LALGGVNEKPKLVQGGERAHGEQVHGSIDEALQPFWLFRQFGRVFVVGLAWACRRTRFIVG